MPPTGFYYKVEAGDTLSSIAKKHGIDDWNDIYNHDKNKSFRKNRPNPHEILIGDMVWIPGVNPNLGSGTTGKPSVVVIKPPLPMFNLELIDQNDTPVSMNTSIQVTFSDGHKEIITTTGGTTKVHLHLPGKIEVYFMDGWILKDKKATFWRKWDEAVASDKCTVKMKVLVLLPGDILLRAGSADDSILIMKITGHPYSHAGMVVRDSIGILKAIDAYPGREPHAVATISIEEYFDSSHATSGIIVRCKNGLSPSLKAAEWALSQTSVQYSFDIMDDYSNNNHSLYCSEFVWRCFLSQSIDLIPVPTNFLSPENQKENTINALIDYAYASGEAPFYAPRSKVRPNVEEYIKNHSGAFVAPYQLAESKSVSKVIEVSPTDATGSGASSGSSKK